MCVSIPIQGWHLSIETWSIRVGSLQDGIRAHVDCRTWPLETGKPIAKIFLYNFPFQKDLLPLFSSELIQISPFSETIPPFPFWPHEDSTDETTPRSTRYRKTETIRNEEDFTRHYDNGNYNCWRLWRLGEFEDSEEFSRFVWPRKNTLMELGRLWKLSIPEI